MQKRDLAGQKFGRLTVISKIGSRKGRVYWNCLFDCGNKVSVSTSNLRTGNTKSCGCYQKQKASKDHKKHGMRNHRLYGIWVNMRSRCYNKNMNRYYTYGGRNITVCDEWLGEKGFQNFSSWALSNGYSDDLTIDRKDNDKGYSPDNCR